MENKVQKLAKSQKMASMMLHTAKVKPMVVCAANLLGQSVASSEEKVEPQPDSYKGEEEASVKI